MTHVHLSQPSAGAETTLGFDVADRGLLLADGVFDTSLVRDGRIVLRNDHITRLLRACEALSLNVSKADLEALCDQILGRNVSGALRLTVTRGPGGRGLSADGTEKPTLLARLTEGTPAFPAAPMHLTVSRILRNPTAPSAQHKTLAYTDAVMGQIQARNAGFDDALYCTPDGHIACSSIANIFARYGNCLVTPPKSDGAIEGVMRGWILRTAAEHGYEPLERSLSLADIASADSVFLTNSLRLLIPVRGIDEMAFHPRVPEELLSGLAEA